MMKLEGISAENPDIAGTLVHVAVDGAYAGYIVISDEIKDDAARAILLLKASGIRKTIMLTGDARAPGEKTGSALGLDEVYSELLPDQKVEKLDGLRNEIVPGARLPLWETY